MRDGDYPFRQPLCLYALCLPLRCRAFSQPMPDAALLPPGRTGTRRLRRLRARADAEGLRSENVRQCEVCACSIEHLHPAKMTCSDACRREKKRRYDAIYDKNRPHVLQPIVKTKSCPSCCKRGERLPASAFQRNRSSCDGLQPYCKACRAKYDSRADQKMKNAKRKHEWYVRNADRLNRRQKGAL